MWFRVYAATMVFLSVAFFLAFWQFLTPADPNAVRDLNPPAVAVVLVWLLILGGGALYGVAAMVPYRPWGWTVGLVAICLGLAGCLSPFAIALLVYWIKPEAKAAFGRI